MSDYLQKIEATSAMLGNHSDWSAIKAEYAVRMQLQNRFKTGLDIAQFTADIMRKDMAEYDADTSKYTCLLYTSPSPRDRTRSRMPSSA